MHKNIKTQDSLHRLFLCLLIVWSSASAQVPQTPRPSTQDEVVRVYTELVQTDVMVFDKEGRFVHGLKRDDFQLRVDGQLVPIQAFDLIRTGTNEEARFTSGSKSSNTDPAKLPPPVLRDRGRTILFYLDDFHLDLTGFSMARRLMIDFVEKDMGQNDYAAITTATGQLGFLQQLTDDRTVLRHAIERLKPRFYTMRDNDRPRMSEYAAMLIDNHDRETLNFYITETIRRFPGMPRDLAEGIVRGRSTAITQEGAGYNTFTLTALENLVRSLAGLPGRKVLFLLSSGFLIQNQRSDSLGRIQRVTGLAAKSGVVIYSVDVRGLVYEPGDIADEKPFDPTGQLRRATQGELRATQDGLNALARDTGGKPVFNTNDLLRGVRRGLGETSTYYLLAWKPDSNNPKSRRFRNIEVTVVGRSDLTVRVPRGIFDIAPSAQPNTQQAEPLRTDKTVPAQLREAIVAPFPKSDLPITLTAVYYDVVPQGPTISASVQIPGQFMTYVSQTGKIQASVDLTGIFYNSRGEPVTSFFQQIVSIAPNAEAAKNQPRDITFTYPAALKPGLYQVRVAARDQKNGRTGSAHAWVEIPDLASKKLAMSSLLLGERTGAMIANANASEIAPITQTANQRFHRESYLRFLLFAYNVKTSPADGKPDLTVQVEVLRDNKPVIAIEPRKVNTQGADLSRLPYAAELTLGSLTPGEYVLRVMLVDRSSKQTTSQQTHFEVY